MVPFSPQMFADTVTFYKGTRPTTPGGTSRVVFPAEGVEMPASVQRATVSRQDGQGRVYSDTMHTVRTMEDPGCDMDDKFVYRGHVLIARGHAEPGGIGDVIWITQCQETRN